MSGKNKWTRKGYEVHTSKDGEDWYRYMGVDHSRRPMFTDKELSAARAAYAKAKKEHKHTRLIKLEMNYELVESTTTAETEQEKKSKILAAAVALFKDDPSVKCYECSHMSMDTMQISPSRVMVEIQTRLLECGPEPRRVEFKGPDGKAQFSTAVEEWLAKARPLHEAKAQMITSKLKEAGIPYRTSQYNGFKVFCLA